MSRLFIFIGRSGCGKGTQADLLEKFLREKEPTRPVLRIETGKLFREEISQPGYTNKLMGEAMKAGKRMPDFMAVYNWGQALLKQFTGEEDLILDGSPRSLAEAQVLDSVTRLYPNLQIVVILLNIKRETALARMLTRGRQDDSVADINRRLDWFDRDVAPALEYFRQNSSYKFLDIDGEPSVEEIHQAIISQL